MLKKFVGSFTLNGYMTKASKKRRFSKGYAPYLAYAEFGVFLC